MINETKERLVELRLRGMLKALEEQLMQTDINSLSFEERLGLIVDRECLDRENRKLQGRLKQSKLKQDALIEDIDYQKDRGIDKAQLMSLASCEWIVRKRNVIITGPTGAGKTYIASALAKKACREGYSAVYYRTSRLLEELFSSRGDGTYMKTLERISKMDLLVLDDWGMEALDEIKRKDVLELIEDRYDLHSTILVSQVPIDNWFELIGDPTVADAILDRLVHNSYKLILKGGSMRKKLKGVDLDKQISLKSTES